MLMFLWLWPFDNEIQVLAESWAGPGDEATCASTRLIVSTEINMPDKGSFEAPQTGGTGKKNVHRVDVGVKDCAIRSVVVFKDRAEVKRVVSASLVAGENEIIIGGLAECVDKNSIR